MEEEFGERRIINLQAHAGPRWASAAEIAPNTENQGNVFDQVVAHIGQKRAGKNKVVLTAWTEGSLDRLLQVLAEHGLERVQQIRSLSEVETLKKGVVATAILNLEGGFDIGELTLIGEQDILGDRLVRRGRRKKKGADFITEVAGMEEGDIVVHAEHGIGKFLGLRTIEAAGAPHACLELRYAEQAKLFLPVENIELLSRYGSEASAAVLDKLGGVAWQSRKAKLKKTTAGYCRGVDPHSGRAPDPQSTNAECARRALRRVCCQISL